MQKKAKHFLNSFEKITLKLIEMKIRHHIRKTQFIYKTRNKLMNVKKP